MTLKASKERETPNIPRPKSSAKTEPFYIGGRDNSKGVVYREFSSNKSVRKAIPVVVMTDKEEQMTTKDVIFDII